MSVKDSEELKAYGKAYYAKNRAAVRERQHKYNLANRAKIAAWHKEYRKDPVHRLAHRLRNRLNFALKNNSKKGSAVSLLGCTLEELKRYLESKWLPGMSWENWSKDGWHVDHVVPLASFDLTDKEQLEKACHYTNLQPLWAKDNLRKGDSLNYKE